MKKEYTTYLITLIFLGFSLNILGNGIKVEVTPNPLFLGEIGEFGIVSTMGPPILRTLPEIDGLEWVQLSPSTSIQMINFDRIDKISYQLTCKKPGIFSIPSLAIQVGNQTFQTKPIAVTVKERRIRGQNQSLSMDDLIFLEVVFDGENSPPKNLYVGQEMSIEIKLYVSNKLQIFSDKFNQSRSFTSPNNYFPKVQLKNVVFKDYSAQNKFNSNFLYEDGKSAIIGEGRFQVFSYQANVSAIEIGTIEGEIEHTIPIVDPNQQNRRRRDNFDDFFNFSGFTRRNKIFSHSVKKRVERISVLSIPDDESDAGRYLGLIGDWEVQLNIDRSTVSVGEDITLTLEVKGKGNISTFTAPELGFPGFRVYPPEVTRKSGEQSSGTIKWVVIPLNSDSQLPGLKFKTFDPVAMEFNKHEFTPKVSIRIRENLPESGPIVEDYGSEDPLVASKPREIHKTSDILYIKKEIGPSILLPLWKNAITPIFLIGLAGPLLYISVLVFLSRQEKLQGSSSFKRRRDALKSKNKILNSLKCCNEEELPSQIREKVIPYLLALVDLPPGATITELLSKIEDKQLAEILQQAELGGYMPGKKTKISASLLQQKIKRFTLILLCIYFPYEVKGVSPSEEAAGFYDRGQIEAAEKIYNGLLESNQNNADLLFNLGNCAYRKSEYGKAIVFYEKARRISPQDTDISENLNFVRSQLNLPPIYSKDTPVQILTTMRDKWRPDRWLFWIAGGWFCFWIFLSINRWKRQTSKFSVAISIILILLGIGAYISQIRGTYGPNQAVVLSQNTPVYRLPGKIGGQEAKSVLNTGDYISIVEKRSEWTRIRIDREEGWVRNGSFGKVW